MARKKTAKSEVAVASGKSGVSRSRAKKEKAEKQNEAKKELDRLFALSTTGEDLNSTSEEGSGEGSGSEEGGENARDGDTRKGKRRDGSQPASEDDNDIEVEPKGERRGPDKRKSQGGVKSKRVPAKKKEPRVLRQLRALNMKDRYVSSLEM